MAIEVNVTGVVDLNSEWPRDNELIREGAAHIRNLKHAVQLESRRRIGMISIWFGALSELPPGFVVCDGQNGTPDMRGLMPIGVNNDGSTPSSGGYKLGQKGGSATHTLTAAEMPQHNHSAASAAAGLHRHGGNTNASGEHNHGGLVGGGGSHSHSGGTSTAGWHGHSGSTNWSGNHTHQQIAARYSTATSGLNYNGKENHPTATQATSAAGNHNHSLNIDGNGNHTHSLNINAVGNHQHGISGSGTHTHGINDDGAHTHTISVSNAGQSVAHNNMPPYRAVHFIMQIEE